MNLDESLKELDLDSRWVSVGFYSPENVIKMANIKIESQDKNLEHFRWRLFSDFWQNGIFLNEEGCDTLLNLIYSEVDPGVRSAMLFELLEYKFLPENIVNILSKNEFKTIRNKAAKRLAIG